ncbi:MAG: ribonuclease P protein component [Flavobacteriales bacterium]|jgi:ribonuclease P protein component|nr:ribonuclease P protein component [Flavobacteriales bacterium]
MPRHTFRKQEVLRGTTRIRALMAGGRSVNVAPFRLTAMYMELPTPYPAQVAFAVPRRVLRHAVDRNRVKRLMREAWRLNKEQWYGRLREKERQCAVLIVYRGDARLTLTAAALKISRAMERWLNEHG